MPEIMLLPSGHRVIVDDDDYEKLSQYRWHVIRGRKTFYAVTDVKINGRYKRLLIHRLINQTPDGLCTDHVNRDGLDNRKCNLRNATRSQNQINRDYFNLTGFRGVVKKFHKYQARIRQGKKTKVIGNFDTAEEAAKAYDAAAVEMYGEYACTNFSE